MEKKDQWNIGYWIVAGLLLLTLQNYWQAAKTVEPVPYSEFEKALAEGIVPSKPVRIDITFSIRRRIVRCAPVMKELTA